VVLRAMTKLVEMFTDEEWAGKDPGEGMGYVGSGGMMGPAMSRMPSMASPRISSATLPSGGTSSAGSSQPQPKSTLDTRERQQELSDVTVCLGAMDLQDVEEPWWTDPKSITSSKEHKERESTRVRTFFEELIDHPAPVVGVVAHSLLFQRLLHLHWPEDDEAAQNAVSEGIRNGASPDGLDVRSDKMMNCGTIVFTFDVTPEGSHLSSAEFMFGGHMESALSSEQWSIGSEDLPDEDEAHIPDELDEEKPKAKYDDDDKFAFNDKPRADSGEAAELEDIWAFLGEERTPRTPRRVCFQD